MDKLSPQARSENMRRIRSRDMKPELAVRRLVHSLGYRYRLHRSDLPGKPDLVFVSRQKVIFVHGCFWHQHTRCIDGKLPQSRQEYWVPKLHKNKERDRRNLRRLRRSGWKCLVVWECQTKDSNKISARILSFLG